MYYLLENGKIIDSRISYTANFPYWEIKDNCLFAKSKNDKLVRPYNKNKIKKQSENVYDLIEKDKDLIKYKYSIDEIKFEIVTSLCESPDGIKTGSLLTKYSNRIIPFFKVLSIYKPDANGNYIKVWEVY